MYYSFGYHPTPNTQTNKLFHYQIRVRGLFNCFMDSDTLFNYEKQCYNKGYEEGYSKGKTQGHTEGRELGIQTGFLRYLPMGVLQARVQDWQNQNNSESIAALSSLVDTPDLTNNPDTVDDVDRRLKLAKNKCRLAANSHKSPPVVAHDQKITYQRSVDGTTAMEDMY